MFTIIRLEFQPGLSALQGMWVGSSRNERRGSHPSDPDKHHYIVKVDSKVSKQLQPFHTCIWVWIRNRFRKTKSLCSVFSISTTPHGYWIEQHETENGKRLIRSSTTCLPRTFLPPMSRTVLAPTLAGKVFEWFSLCLHLCVQLRYMRIFNKCAMPTRAKGRLCFNFSFCSLKSSSSSESQSGNW